MRSMRTVRSSAARSRSMFRMRSSVGSCASITPTYIHPLKLCHITNPTHTMANRWCELNLLECAGYSPVYEERSDFTQTLRSSYTEFYPQNQCGPLAAAQRVRDRWSGCGAGSARAHPSPRHTPACIDFGIVGYEMRVQVCGI